MSVFLAKSGEFIEKGEIDLVIGSKSHVNILAYQRPKLTVGNPHVFSRAGDYIHRIWPVLESQSDNKWFLLSGSYLLENNREFIEVSSFVLLLFWLVVYGKNVPAVVEQPLEEEKMHPGKNTVTYEARVLKSLFLRLV